MKTQSPVELQIERLSPEGPGVAALDGRRYRVWNALPGELVTASVIGKKGAFEAVASSVLRPSSHRITSREDHFLCCSPWQVLSFEAENRWKSDFAAEIFRQAGVPIKGTAPIFSDGRLFGYRNKMEYSFTQTADGLSFAFFERSWKRKRSIEPCLLADPAINATAEVVVAWLKDKGVSESEAKSLIVRSSGAGETLAGLFVRTEDWAHGTPAAPGLTGFQVHYSDPRSSASVSTKLLLSTGQGFLETRVRSLSLRFGLFSFFQVNLPVFGKALEDIAPYVEPGRPFLDLYGGVGTIGLSLHARASRVTVVETGQEMVRRAEENICLNKIGNAWAHAAPVEKVLELVVSDAVIGVDPPRSGLHPKLIRHLLETRPFRVIYLSCNVATQAKDVSLLLAGYGLKDLKFYNFFPRTPHLESLAILERKNY